MEQITVYKTSDGQKFEDQSAAKEHQIKLDFAREIEVFLDKHYPKVEGRKAGPVRGIAAGAISKWLAEGHMANGGIDNSKNLA